MRSASCLIVLLLFLPAPAIAQAKKPLELMDVFSLEFASEPQITRDGKRVVYVRNFMDVMKDKRFSNLWIVGSDGSGHQALTAGNHVDSSPRLSPDGTRALFVSDRAGTPQVHCLWLDTGRMAKLTNLASPPVGPVWSPDGKQIAFASLVVDKRKPFVELPAKPEGAEWAAPLKVIDKIHYRFDGKGYLKVGYHQLFVVSAEGGAARQVTSGHFQHNGSLFTPQGPTWSHDGKSLLFSAVLKEDAEHYPLDTEIHEVRLEDGKITTLTDRRGPDHTPAVSPDGKHIAYIGFDDKKQGHQNSVLYVMERDGKNPRVLLKGLDRSVRDLAWDDKTVFFLFDDLGVTKIGYASEGAVLTVTRDVGGEVLDRPYAAGSFSVARSFLAFTQTCATRPADVAVTPVPVDRSKALPSGPGSRGDGVSGERITHLNDHLLAARDLASVEEIFIESSHDKRKIPAWLVKPPNFDPKKSYPLILEIHGGPFANYGPRFAMNMQLFAAAGYVVLYVNPRGSTSYGEEFANLIHHAYPGHDHDDLMSAVDHVIKMGFVDPERLFITGGSGGGVLTAWAIGKTTRFRAAVVAKPVINWHSFALTADAYPFFTQYWFPGPPWEHAEHYHKRSPLSLVGKVTTPTMVMTGEEDHRTPMAQSEEYYQALKLRKVPAVLVRIPGAAHNFGARPSHMMSSVAHTLRWFALHDAKAK